MRILKRSWMQLEQHPNQMAFSILVTGLVLYILTLAPGLLWGGGDFSTFQTKAYTGQIESNVFGHPLWVILARPFLGLPVRDIAYRANLAAAFFAAGALAFIYLAARLLTRSTGASLLATAALMVSHLFWTYGVLPKPYSLNAFLLSACLFLVLRWRDTQKGKYLYLAAGLYGLGPFNHLVMLTSVAGFAVFITLVARQSNPMRRQAFVAIGWLALGLVPFLMLELMPGTDRSASTAIGPFLRGLLDALTVPSRLAIGLGAGLGLLLYQFIFLTPLGFFGLWRLWKIDRPAAAFLILIALGDIAFLLGATDPRTGGDYVWNLHYYLMFYLVFALGLAYGLAVWWPRLMRTAAHRAAIGIAVLLVPIALYGIAPIAARPFLSNMPGFRQLGGRDNLTYVLSPWKHPETGARLFADDIMNALPPHSAIFADYSIWSMLNYLQVVENARLDVSLFQLPAAGADQQLPFIAAHASLGDLFLADTNQYYDIDLIQAHFTLRPKGPIYQLILK